MSKFIYKFTIQSIKHTHNIYNKIQVIFSTLINNTHYMQVVQSI